MLNDSSPHIVTQSTKKPMLNSIYKVFEDQESASAYAKIQDPLVSWFIKVKKDLYFYKSCVVTNFFIQFLYFSSSAASYLVISA